MTSRLLAAVLVLGLAFLVGAPLVVGNASAGFNGAPTLGNAFIVGNGDVLVFVGYGAFGDVWEVAGNGSQIYADQLWLVAFDLRPFNVTLTIDTFQQGHGWVQNQSLSLNPQAQADIYVTFAQDPNWRHAAVYMDATPWVGQVATPISLLPATVVNLGGLDLLVLGVVSEALVSFAAILAFAAWAMRRAIFAPKFSLLIWGHVILLLFASTVLLDYQFIDSVFAGWSPLVYVLVIAPTFFLFSLSLFNKHQRVEILQHLIRPQGRGLFFRRWLVSVGKVGDKLVLVLETWGGFWARFWGHHVVIDEGDPDTAQWFAAEVEMGVSPTLTASRPTRSKRIGRKWRQTQERFVVSNTQKDRVDLIWFTKTGRPITVTWPRLVWFRTVEIPAKLSAEGQVLVAAHPKRKLSRPHYTEGHAEIDLMDAHYEYAAAVAAGWASADDLARENTVIRTELEVIKAHINQLVDNRVESALTAHYALHGRTFSKLTDAEAFGEAGKALPSKLGRLLDEPSEGEGA